MIKTVSTFLIRPEFKNFARLNTLYYCIALCLGAFAGSLVSANVIATAVYGSVHLATGRLKWALPRPVTMVFLAFCGFFAADLIAAAIHPSFVALTEIVENLPFLGFAAIYSITVIDRRKLLDAVEIAAAVASFAAALIVLFSVSEDGRPELASGNASVLALLGGVLFVLNIVAAMRSRNYRVFVFLAAAGCASYLVISTGTRAIWPVLLVIPLLALLFFCSVKQIVLALPVLVVLLGGAAALVATYSTSMEARIESARDDIRDTLSGDLSGSIGQRVQIYQAGYELFLERPVFGYGPGNERPEIRKKTAEIGGVGIAYSHAHNAALNAALRAGILGILALAAIVITPFAVAFRAERDEVGQAGFFILTGVLVVYLFSGVVGLMFGHDIHDTVFISAMSFALYLVFGRAPTADLTAGPEAA